MLPPSGLPWRPCTNRFQWRVSGLGELVEYVTSSESREEREMGEGRACKVSAYQPPNGGLARVGDRSERVPNIHIALKILHWKCHNFISGANSKVALQQSRRMR